MSAEKLDIVAIFEHYGLRVIGADRGGWQRAQCPSPEHEDRNPSASLSQDAGKWFCHSCGRGGDGYDIIQEREGFAGFNLAKQFGSRFLDGSGESVRDDSGPGGGFLSKPRRNKGYRNQPAPWMRL